MFFSAILYYDDQRARFRYKLIHYTTLHKLYNDDK